MTEKYEYCSMMPMTFVQDCRTGFMEQIQVWLYFSSRTTRRENVRTSTSPYIVLNTPQNHCFNQATQQK